MCLPLLASTNAYASLRRAVARPLFHAARPRFRHAESKSPSFTGSSLATHLFAGIAGGAIVIGSGHVRYQFSGIKQEVDTAKAAAAYFESTKQAIKEKGSNSPNIALFYLRIAAKISLSAVPGSGLLVDRMFDSVDEIVEQHGEGAKAITDVAFTEVLVVICRRMDELRSLDWKATASKPAPLLEKYPEARNQLSTGLRVLRELAKAKNVDAPKASDGTKEHVRSYLSLESSKSYIACARKLVEDKTASFRKDDAMIDLADREKD